MKLIYKKWISLETAEKYDSIISIFQYANMRIFAYLHIGIGKYIKFIFKRFYYSADLISINGKILPLNLSVDSKSKITNFVFLVVSNFLVYGRIFIFL